MQKPLSQSIMKILPWINKGGMAIFDQALFAGANFIVNILLARWLNEEQYGAYVVVYSIFLLLFNFYDAAIIEPMSIYGPGKYAKEFKRYLGILFQGHILITGVIGLIMIGVGYGFLYTGSPDLAKAFIGFGFITPVFIARWLTRQPFYVLSKPSRAALGNFIYLVIIIIGMFILSRLNNLDVINALTVMGIASIVSITVLLLMLKPIWSSHGYEITLNKVIEDHVSYGKWSSSIRILRWMESNIFYLFLPVLVGLSGSAGLRALMNLSMPVLQTMWALVTILVPEFVRAFKSGGKPKLNRFLRNVIVIQTLLGSAFIIVLMLFGEALILLLYDGKYNDYSSPSILFLVALLPILTGYNVIISGALSAMGRIDLGFRASLVSGILTLTVGIFMTARFGIVGSFIGWLISAGSAFLVLAFLYIRLTPSKRKNEMGF